MNRFPARLPVTGKKKSPPSRFARLLDFVVRHGGVVAVDPLHMAPLDRPRPFPRSR